MRGFITVVFAFLGFAFYELSGGSGYEPVANSIQARAKQAATQNDAVRVAARADYDAKAQAVSEDVTRSSLSLGDLTTTRVTQPGNERFEITLASAQPREDITPQTVDASAEMSRSVRSDEMMAAIEAAVEQAVSEEQRQQPVFSLETYSVASADSSGASLFTTSRRASGGTSGEIRVVTGNRVNMRSGPGTDFQPVGSLIRGAEVAVVDEPGNGWLMIEVVSTGETGWMADWLVTASND